MAVESAKTTLRVLEAIAQSGVIGVSQLARDLEEPKAKIQRNLVTLHECGWIVPVEGGPGSLQRKWSLASKMSVIAQGAGTDIHLRRAAQPIMEDLWATTQESINLVVPEARNAVLIEHFESPKVLRTAHKIGAPVPLHASATGKAILAAMSDEELDLYLRIPLRALSEHTITDPDALRQEIDRIRRDGYSVSRGEMEEHIRSVAASIRLREGRVLGALSISCPAVRLPENRCPEYGAIIRDGADRVARELVGH